MTAGIAVSTSGSSSGSVASDKANEWLQSGNNSVVGLNYPKYTPVLPPPPLIEPRLDHPSR